MRMESTDLPDRKQNYDVGETKRSEFGAAQRLQRIATQLIDARGIEALYDQILDTVLAILNSDFASLQMFYPERGSGGELRLLGHRGFSAEATRRWEWVRRENGYGELRGPPVVRLYGAVKELRSKMSGIVISWLEAKIWTDT